MAGAFRTRSVLLVALLLLATALLAFATPRGEPRSAEAVFGGAPEMGLSLSGPLGCELLDPTYCYAEGPFTLSVDAVAIPPDGYLLAQAWVSYGDSLGNQSANGATKNSSLVWPDCDPVVYLETNTDEEGGTDLDSYSAACATALLPPLPASFYEGSLYTIGLTCPDTFSSHVLELIPEGTAPAGSFGTLFVDSNSNEVVPKVNSITINCVTHSIFEGDGDGDGCFDRWEFLTDETAGGLRDWQNPWDYYDVAVAGGAKGQDETIDLPNDILGVIQRYAPAGTEAEYDAHYDRGPADGSAGPHPWNMTAPDGVIDLGNDILGVILQYQHNCDDPFT